jgi:hypothetical protein
MARVQEYLKNYAMTVAGAKQHMRTAIRQLGELDFDTIAKMLLANSENEPVPEPEIKNKQDEDVQAQSFVSESGCGAVFTRKGTMARHISNHCKLRTSEPA